MTKKELIEALAPFDDHEAVFVFEEGDYRYMQATTVRYGDRLGFRENECGIVIECE